MFESVQLKGAGGAVTDHGSDWTRKWGSCDVVSCWMHLEVKLFCNLLLSQSRMKSEPQPYWCFLHVFVLLHLLHIVKTLCQFTCVVLNVFWLKHSGSHRLSHSDLKQQIQRKKCVWVKVFLLVASCAAVLYITSYLSASIEVFLFFNVSVDFCVCDLFPTWCTKNSPQCNKK